MIDVTNMPSKTLTVRLKTQTEITRDKKKLDVSELRVGLSVVVDAYGDNERDLLAVEIRIVPRPAARGNSARVVVEELLHLHMM